MLRILGIGHLAFAAGLLGIGTLGLIHGDFALQWQAMPAALPWRAGLAYASSVVLILATCASLYNRSAVTGALVLLVYLLLFWLLPHVPAALSQPANVAAWLGVSESLAACCGAWILWAGLRRAVDPGATPRRDPAAPLVRGLFGLSCLVFGLSHFVYAEFTAQMVPDWLPARLPLAYLTGAGHSLAGLALLSGIVPRLAATLEATMMGAFVLLLHLPSAVIAPPPAWAPTARIQWTALCWALTLAASAALLAYALRDRPWGFDRGTR